MAIIVGVLGILLFICIEVAPILGDPAVDRRDPLTVGQPALFMGVEEQQELGFAVLPNGTIEIIKLAEPERRITHKLSSASSVLSVARPLGRSQLAIGTADGRVIPVDVRFRAEFDALGARRIVPEVVEGSAFSLDADGKPILTLAWQIDVKGSLAAGITEDGRVLVAAVVEKKLLTGAVKRTEARGDVTPLLTKRATCLALDRYRETLYVGQSSGAIARVDVADVQAPKLIESFPASDNAVTAVGLLNGDLSLVVGDERGEVSVWFGSSDADGPKRFRRVHGFEPHGAAVTSIGACERDRGFVTADRAGGVRLHYATTGKTLARLQGESHPVTSVLLAPKANAIYALHDRGMVSRWSLKNPHPEVSVKAFFGQVWYEGYNAPEAVWQSTGGTDDFEPKFSLIPLIFGTLKGTFYALVFAVPLAILGALYTSQFMHPTLRGIVKPTVEIMAALPSVVLGFLAGLWLAPVVERSMPAIIVLVVVLPMSWWAAMGTWNVLPARLREASRSRGEIGLLIVFTILAVWLGASMNGTVGRAFFGGDFQRWWVNTTGLAYDQRNALVVGFAMAFAVIPIIFTISEDSLSNVPRHLSSGSLALGATRWQTAIRVVLPTASPGILSAVMIGFGRAVGETMIVLMATGNTPVMEWNIFNGFRTLSANIAVEIPEAPHGGTLYRVLFMAALLLFAVTFAVNTLAEVVRQRMRRRYAQL